MFGGATRLHALSKDQLLETFTGTGWGRFVPVARLLPLAALLTALLLYLGLGLLEERRTSRGRST